MNLEATGQLPFEKAAINKGVKAFEIVGTSQGVSIIRIRYQCPLTKEQFHFNTNLSHIPPGLVA